MIALAIGFSGILLTGPVAALALAPRDGQRRLARLYVPSLRRLTLDVRIEGYPDGPGRASCKEDEP